MGHVLRKVLCALGRSAGLALPIAASVLTFSGAAAASVPPSAALSMLGIDAIDRQTVPPPDVEALLAEDARPRNEPTPLRVALAQPLVARPAEAGTWELLANGGRLWRLRVVSPGAVFLSFKFSEFVLPVGVELYFFSVNRDYRDGPYTARHNRGSLRFGSPMIPGDDAIIELHLPPGAGEPRLALESVSHGYRDVLGMGSIRPRPGRPSPRPAEPSATSHTFGDFACQRDINCPEGAPYQNDKRAVAEGYDGSFICTGTVVNNTAQDCRYLYLTAEHCEWWRDPTTMAYYWRYENSGCGTNNAPFIFSTGSTDLWHSAAADVDLLELDGTDLASIHQIWFSGWNRGAAAPASGATISFPDDKPKQIAIENDAIVNCAPTGCPGGFGASFWRVNEWDVGVTEGGSSGAGLLDPAHRLVGVLTGGVGTDCSDFEWDEFAKIGPVWSALAPYLDPGATGATTLNGLDHTSCSTGLGPPPAADGTNGLPLRLGKGPAGSIAVAYDAQTCSADHAVLLWGALGSFGDYQGDVGASCDLGSDGQATFLPPAGSVWFNVVWVNADGTAGHPGFGTPGPRAWSAAGLCGVTADDASDPTCD